MLGLDVAGNDDGKAEGNTVGQLDGLATDETIVETADGGALGTDVFGLIDGCADEGVAEGLAGGFALGTAVEAEGCAVGFKVVIKDGDAAGPADGLADGIAVGAGVWSPGSGVGRVRGAAVGKAERTAWGETRLRKRTMIVKQM